MRKLLGGMWILNTTILPFLLKAEASVWGPINIYFFESIVYRFFVAQNIFSYVDEFQILIQNNMTT
jgi:hypothetical protein